MEIIELDNHPYYVATQYHPEYLSRPLKPSPPFLGLILASVGKLKSYLARGCRLSPRNLSDDETGKIIFYFSIIFFLNHIKITHSTVLFFFFFKVPFNVKNRSFFFR